MTSKKTNVKSCESLESIGIGAAQASDGLKLIPDGLTNPNDRLYDCVVALIYCPEHRKVAVMNTRREHIVWAPFLQLREGQSWDQGTLDCIQRAIGRQDAELTEAEAAKQAPTFELAYLDVMQIQVPSVNSITRICQLVTIQRSSFKCCTKSHRIEWIPLTAFGKNQHGKAYSHHWGPELRMWCTQLERFLAQKNDPTKLPPKVMRENTISQELRFFANEQKDTAEYKALQAIKFKPIHAIEVYEDFLKHCYPSLYMKFESFRLYLTKNAFLKSGSDKTQAKKNEDAAKLVELYDLFRTKKNDFIDFQELLIGLVAMDPYCKDKIEVRIRYLFRYYAKGKPHFNEDDLRRLAVDMNSTAGKSKEAYEHSRKLLKHFGVVSADKLTFTIFFKCLVNHSFEVTRLLRFQRSVLAQTSPQFGRKVSKPEERKTVKSVVENSSQCFACRKKEYEYSMHVVTIDSDRSCCIPSIINQGWLKDALYPEHRKYSIEYTYSSSSISNTFLDLVRIFNRTKVHLRCSSGLMSAREEVTSFVSYLQRLCRALNGILVAEPKLIRLNGPAIVVGDLQGNLDGLLAMEEALFPNFPIIPENLVFLGNYTGEYKFGVECLIFLFSLKICSPNKVFLLRGISETRLQSGSLRDECYNKYGRQKGNQIFEAFNDIFTKLPLAMILDETILCVHSGIPQQTRKIAEMMATLPAQIFDPQKDAPIIYELLTRYPLSNKHINGSVHTVDNDLLGNHHGDQAFHTEQRSISIRLETGSLNSRISSKSAAVKSSEGSSLKSSSGGAVKSGLDNVIKSFASDSIKSIKTNVHDYVIKSTVASTKSSKSSKSAKKSTSSVICTKSTRPDDHYGKSVISSMKSAYHGDTGYGMQETRSVSTTCSTLSVTTDNTKVFPQPPSSAAIKEKSTKTSPGRNKLESASEPSSQSSQSSTYKIFSSGPSLPLKRGFEVDSKDEQTFDGRAFEEFMFYNSLAYMIRGSSVCKHGFKLNFKNRCLSLFSCSNLAPYTNEAAVLLVNRDTAQLRLMTLKSPKSETLPVSQSIEVVQPLTK